MKPNWKVLAPLEDATGPEHACLPTFSWQSSGWCRQASSSEVWYAHRCLARELQPTIVLVDRDAIAVGHNHRLTSAEVEYLR